MAWLFSGIGDLANFVIGCIFGMLDAIFDFIFMILNFFVYNLISLLFQVFTTVAQTNILDQGDVAGIYQRITMILTIVMTFYITFEFVKYVVSPNTMTDKEKGAGNVVFRMVIAIILIAFVPKIFTIAYDLQSKVINNQVIPTIILGKKSEDHQRLGSAFAADTMSMFIRVNEEGCSKNTAKCSEARKAVEKQLQQMRESGEMNLAFSPLVLQGITIETSPEVKVYRAIEINGLLALIVGGFILYILVLYAIDLGKRYAQMIYLQIIAPIAIIGYISPKKDGIFQKWTKQCLTTYLDVFIRLSIIYLILLIIGVLNESKDTLFNISGAENVTFGVGTLSYLALVMGLLAFANKAPKLLQELFPSSGAASIGFGLNSKERFEPTIKAVKGTVNAGLRTAGAVAGAVGGYQAWKALKAAGASRPALSAIKTGYRSIKAGAGKQGNPRKAMQAAMDSYQKDLDIISEKGDPYEADFHGTRYQKIAQEYDRKIKLYGTGKKYKETVYESTNEVSRVASLKATAKAVESGGGTQAEIDAANNTYKSSRKAVNLAVAKEIMDASAGNRAIDFNNITTITYDVKDSSGNVIGNQTFNVDNESDKMYMQQIAIKLESMFKEMKNNPLGELEVNGKRVDAMDIKELAAALGDIELAGQTEITNITNKDEYKKAKANAQASGKK